MKRLTIVTGGAALVLAGALGFGLPAPDSSVEAGAAAEVAAPVETPTETPVVPAAAAGAVVAAASEPSADAPVREPALEILTGSASYYADRFEGRTTASGVPFRQAELWAAHKTLPFGTRLRVTNLANGREVEVEVVDRGPYARGRILDLSRTAARRLGFIRAGHTRVRVEVLEKG